MLDKITPVILTRNEAPNIERTLGRLAWARDIVVVDSFSGDTTVERASRFHQVRLFQRSFDSHASQWTFAVNETGISSDWVLALDADYVLSEGLIEELASLQPNGDVAGYRASFRYLIEGRPLRGSTYPPVTILYRRARTRYLQDGHTQRAVVNGRIERLHGVVLHDDRKSLSDWVDAQRRYMKLEAEKLTSTAWADLKWKDRLRKLKVVAPVAMAFYCLLVKGAILDGRAGLYYTLQRVFAELLLSLYLLDRHTRRPRPAPSAVGSEIVDHQ